MQEFDKGCGFTIVTNDTVEEKIEEQLGKAAKVKRGQTSRLTSKFQKKLYKLRRENKFTSKTYFELYTSDPIPPRLYDTRKAHKPEINFPTRIIVSTIGTPHYGISKYLLNIIQSTLNKNQHKVKNSKSFVLQGQTWKIQPDELQVSYDVRNLYPSIPIGKAINAILQNLSEECEDYEDLKTRTKLRRVGIQQVIELCVRKCYFLWDDVICSLLNSGPIGLFICRTLNKMLLNYL